MSYLNLFRNQGPQWRLSEIERCLKQRPVSLPRFDDAFISNYLKVAKSLAGGRDTNIKLLKLAEDPQLAPYCEIYQLVANPYGNSIFGKSTTTSYQRSVLDALALCGASFEEIQSLTDVSKEAVEIYEAIFFDVRNRAPYWIISMVLQPIFASHATGNFDVMLKFVSLALGRKGVDQLLFKGALSKEDLELVYEKIAGWRNLKAAASTFMIPVNSFDHIEFEKTVIDERIQNRKLDISAKQAEDEADEEEGRVKEDRDFLKTLLSAHKFTIASKYDKRDDLVEAEEPSNLAEAKKLIVKTVEAEVVRTT